MSVSLSVNKKCRSNGCTNLDVVFAKRLLTALATVDNRVPIEIGDFKGQGHSDVSIFFFIILCYLPCFVSLMFNQKEFHYVA